MEGGKDTFKNTVILHKVCHEKKTSWERKWRAYEKQQLAKELKARG
jgi:5-methylcytosine-specific restriction endonuclease McrA